MEEMNNLADGIAERMAEISQSLDISMRDYSMADWKYEKLMEEISQFQSDLSDDDDVLVALASFGTSTIMQVDEIGYQNPDILYFWGYVNGKKAQLIQHVSQLNFMLMAVKKEKPDSKPHRIGFTS